MKHRKSPTKKAARSKTTPTARTVSPAKPASRKPASRKPASRKPASRKPAAGKSATRKPVARKATKAKAQGREHVLEVLSTFDTVMVVTADGERLRARPMAVKQHGEDGSLTFLTAAETSKVDEAKAARRGAVVAQAKLAFVALDGTFAVLRDPDRVQSLWSAADKVYFPDGPTDPSIRVMVFKPETAEVWDVTGPKGLRFLFEAAKALITGERPSHDGETHDRVVLAQG